MVYYIGGHKHSAGKHTYRPERNGIAVKPIDSQKLSSLISAHTNEELSENKIGSKEVIVHQDGQCIYKGVFGTGSVDGAAAKPGMLYRAASMTKPITAVAVLQLIDKGLLCPEDKVSRFFPAAKDMKVAVVENGRIASLVPLKREITVGNLLSHTSGIGCEPVNSILGCTNNTLSLDEAIEDIFSKPLSFEPDSSQSYSATEAFDVAAGIVQKITDRRFDEYLQENIFTPLEMTNTTFSPTDEQWSRTVPMHNRSGSGESEIAPTSAGCVFEGYLPKRMPAGAGLITTADDYIKFADMLCAGGKTAAGRQIMSPHAVRLMSSPHTPANIENWCEKWGLGVRIIVSDSYPHGLEVGSFGWSGAYGTHFWVDPKNRITAVMMKNSRYDGGAGNRSACQLEKDVYVSL